MQIIILKPALPNGANQNKPNFSTNKRCLSETLDKSNNLNKLNCYLARDHEYKPAEHLFTMRDQKQRLILTKYRPSSRRREDRHTHTQKSSCKPSEETVWTQLCTTGETETVIGPHLICAEILKIFYWSPFIAAYRKSIYLKGTCARCFNDTCLIWGNVRICFLSKT